MTYAEAVKFTTALENIEHGQAKLDRTLATLKTAQAKLTAVMEKMAPNR